MGNGPPEDGQCATFRQLYHTWTSKYLLRRNSWDRRRLRVGNKVIEIRGLQAAYNSVGWVGGWSLNLSPYAVLHSKQKQRLAEKSS